MSSKIIARNTALAAVDTGVAAVCAIVTSVLVGRILGPVKLGHYNYVLWLASFSVALANFGVPSAVGKYAAEFLGTKQLGFAAGVIRRGFRYQLLSGAAVFALGCALALAAEDSSHLRYVLPIVASLPVTMVMAVSTQANTAMERFDANVIPSLSGSLTNVIGVSLTLYRGWDLPGLAVSLLLARLVDSGLRFLLFRRIFRARLAEGPSPVHLSPLPPEAKRRFSRFCLEASFLILINLIVWNRSEMFFLRRFCDITQVAFYSVAFGLVLTIINAAEPFATAVGARLMIERAQDAARAQRTAARFIRFQLLIVTPLAFGLAALSRPLLLVTYGSAYDPAWPVLALAAVLCPAAALVTPATRLIAAGEQQWFSVRWGLASVALTLLLDLLLVWRGAALGAALANGLGQGIAVAGLWVFLWRQCSVRLPLRAIGVAYLAGVGMAAFVRTAVFALAPWPQILVGVPVGVVSYGVLLRALGLVAVEDRQLLVPVLVAGLPFGLGRGASRLVHLVAPNRRAEGENLSGSQA